MIFNIKHSPNSRRLFQFLTAALVLFSSIHDVASRPDGNGLNKNPSAKTAAFQTKSKLTSSTVTPSKISSQASSSLCRIRQEYNDAVKMGIAYDWVNQKRITPKKKKKKASKTSNDVSSKYLCLGPLTNNMRHWHFSFRGAGDVFGKGIYHGRIVLPKDYPLKPPRVQMWTESGRFKPGADICLSASAYHPESWTPRWTIFGLVNALRLHMLQSPIEIGGITRTREEMLEAAEKSRTWSIEWWSGGSVKIHVSHDKLLKEGILTLEDDGDEELRQEVTDELQSLVNQTNETMVDQDVSAAATSLELETTAVEDGQSGTAIITTPNENANVHAPSIEVEFIKKTKSKSKKKRTMDSHSNSSNVETHMQQTEQKALHKRQARNHIRLTRLSRTLTDPIWVAFISILILIWLNKR